VELYLEYVWLSEVTFKSLCGHALSIFIISLAVTHATLLLRPLPAAPPPRLFIPTDQHALIKQIFLTASGCSNKYSHDIPEILPLDEHREELETDEALTCRILPGRA
jgi:hypothetical protein